MRLKHHRLIRPFALSATAAMLAMAVALVWGAGVSLARGTTSATYYEDQEGNVCVGVGGFVNGFPTGQNCERWEVTNPGKDNTGLGEKVMERSTGNENVGVGFDALAENETGTGNTANGFFALLHNHTGNFNTATGQDADYRCRAEGCKENTESGASALRNNESGKANAAFGYQALDWAEGVSGNENVGVGYKAGSKTNGGTNNVDIANEGVAADENTTRIGTATTPETATTPNRAFVAGIYLKALPKAFKACAVKVNSQGQLGCSISKTFAAVNEEALQAQVNRQQQEINKLASELKSLHK
jgi:hypothetical protein